MATSTALRAVPDGMSAEEWQVRVELAACYRLTDLYGWSDLTSTHISARVPGPENHFLLNPFGLLFDEITASSLIKVDMDGNVVGQSDYPINRAGFTIHSAVHMHRHDLQCVMHTHTRAGNAVAMQKAGLLPLTQRALLIHHTVGYHDYEGAALDLDERERILRDLGDNCILVLRNHGLLSVGRTIGEAFVWMYRVEMACRYQVDGLAGGQPLNHLSAETEAHVIEQGRQIFGMQPDGSTRTGREWPALLRKLERETGPDYAT